MTVLSFRPLLLSNLVAVPLAFVHAPVFPVAEFKAPVESPFPAGLQAKAIRNGMLLIAETYQRFPENIGIKLFGPNGDLFIALIKHISGGGMWGVFPEQHSRSGQIISLS